MNIKSTLTAIAVTLVLLSAVACQSDTHNHNALDAALLEGAQSLQDAQHKLHDTVIEGVRLRQGDHAAFILSQCYADGYDSVQDKGPDGSTVWKSPTDLGPKYVAKCSHIAALDQKSTDAYTKRHKVETSQ